MKFELPPFAERPMLAADIELAHDVCLYFRETSSYSTFRIGRRDDGHYLVFPIHEEDDANKAEAAYQEAVLAFTYEELDAPYFVRLEEENP